MQSPLAECRVSSSRIDLELRQFSVRYTRDSVTDSLRRCEARMRAPSRFTLATPIVGRSSVAAWDSS
jgi:hypothetical protein